MVCYRGHSMSTENIPEELKSIPQWVGSDENGAPVNPSTGRYASSTDPTTWATFEKAISCGTRRVAFVFTPDDPYTVIDLDTYNSPAHVATHARIVTLLDSYTEHSSSGAGTHIVVRGSIPRSVHNSLAGVEMYSVDKAMTLTGDVYGSFVINERQPELTLLFDEFATDVGVEVFSQAEEKYSDSDLLSKIANSGQAEKFSKLFDKDDDYLIEAYNKGLNKFDHSKADSALLTILAYWTENDDQAVRIFKTSALYRSSKGRKGSDGEDYIRKTLSRARGFQGASNQEKLMQAVHVSRNLIAEHLPKQPESPCEDIPGLVGELQRYFFKRAVRPVYEVSLGAALALVAGIAGRQFNISATGLNQYIVVIAGTGAGKEDGPKGIGTIVAKVKENDPDIEKFIGPADFASGTGLIGALIKEPCFYSIVGEIGIKLQELSSRNSSDASKSLLRVLLDFYNKSGRDQYAAGKSYAKSKDNTSGIYSPAPTILGDATPSTFYGSLTEMDIATGLIPRFTILEYSGARPKRNKITANTQPDTGLVRKVGALVRKCSTMQKNNSVQDITLNDEALMILDEFDEFCDEQVSQSAGAGEDLWTRAHLKALRIAGLLAVGCIKHNECPTVTKVEASWAVAAVKKEVNTVLDKFTSGQVGQGERVQEAAIRQVITDALLITEPTRLVNQAMIDSGCVPYAYIRQRLRKMQSFYHSGRGAALAIKSALTDLVEADIVVKLDGAAIHEKFDTRSALYAPGKNW